MSNRRWRRHADPDNAVDELLDAAGRAFAEFGVDRATMVDVARMAGCSRATLYRYYPDQDSLHLAFAHRATLRIAEEMTADRGSGAPDSLVERILGGIAHVRADPLLSVWFEPEHMSVPIALSQSSVLLRSTAIGLFGEADRSMLDPGDLERRAGWILRSIVALLAMPGPDAEAERTMIEQFVAPVVTGARVCPCRHGYDRPKALEPGNEVAARSLDEAIEESHAALAAISNGDLEPFVALYSDQDDVTVGNPFGPFARGREAVREAGGRAASRYRDAEIEGFERIATHVADGLACVAEVERFRAGIGGSDGPASVALRVTSVYREEDGIWRLVHRHADPITTLRDAESVVRS